VGEVAIVADRFYVVNPNNPADKKALFVIDTESGAVSINGNLFVSGWITGDMINASTTIQIGSGGELRIGSGGRIIIGEGAIILDSATGSFF
jgi:hypothetical protein